MFSLDSFSMTEKTQSKCYYNEKNINEVINLFFQYIRETNNSYSFPSRELIGRAIPRGMADLLEYAESHKIDIRELDSIKLITFTSFHLLPELSEKFTLTQNVIYTSIINMIFCSYGIKSVKYHPDIKNTARILSEFYHPEEDSKKNKYAVYSYFKGLQESFLALKNQETA